MGASVQDPPPQIAQNTTLAPAPSSGSGSTPASNPAIKSGLSAVQLEKKIQEKYWDVWSDLLLDVDPKLLADSNKLNNKLTRDCEELRQAWDGLRRDILDRLPDPLREIRPTNVTPDTPAKITVAMADYYKIDKKNGESVARQLGGDAFIRATVDFVLKERLQAYVDGLIDKACPQTGPVYRVKQEDPNPSNIDAPPKTDPSRQTLVTFYVLAKPEIKEAIEKNPTFIAMISELAVALGAGETSFDKPDSQALIEIRNLIKTAKSLNSPGIVTLILEEEMIRFRGLAQSVAGHKIFIAHDPSMDELENYMKENGNLSDKGAALIRELRSMEYDPE
jgi:hypothetical protein